MSVEEAAILAPFRERAAKGEMIEIKEIKAAYQAAVDHPISVAQIWKEIRKRGFRNEVFASLTKVMDRLCDTISALTKHTISSITGREEILKCLIRNQYKIVVFKLVFIGQFATIHRANVGRGLGPAVDFSFLKNPIAVRQ